ncbi:MAG: TetR family transcriptional regulator [Limnobacter sp.]|nr:TetR family transcriptional regulator [Limnobacter sp.]
MARKTKEEAQETRHLILDAAQKEFSEKGVAHTSLHDIARRANLTRGAIYWHFKNKADLFNAMLDRVILPMEEFVDHANQSSDEDPIGFVRACALQVMYKLTHEAQTQEVFEIIKHKVELTGDMLPAKTRHLKGRNDCIQNIQSALATASDKALLKPGTDTAQAAIGLHCLIDGLISNWVLDPGAFNLEKQAHFCINQYIDSLLTHQTEQA